jgi:lipase chaperone LimK
MQNIIIGALAMLIAAAFAVYSMYKAQVVTQHAQALIHERDLGEITRLTADNVDLRSRMFASKQMPPPGVDLTKEYAEQKAKEDERKADTENDRIVNPRGTTMLDKARNAAVVAETKEAKKQGAQAG